VRPLRSLFEPHATEVWKQLSAQMGADFIAGDPWNTDQVIAHVGEWTVTLDTVTQAIGLASVPFTRLRAPYVNRDGFRFTIYRKGLFSGLGKRLGMQDIEIGDPAFDSAFIIQGNEPAKAQALFADSRLRELIARRPDLHLEVKDDEGWFATRFPEGVDELSFQVAGVITDREQLAALYDLFAETLHQLCRIGSAYESDPHVTPQT
jgi:hypothetical protein